MMLLFSLLMFLVAVLAKAEEISSQCGPLPAHDEIPNPDGMFRAQSDICEANGEEQKCLMQCSMEALHVLDDDGEIDPEKLANIMIPTWGYDELKAVLAESVRKCETKMRRYSAFADDSCVLKEKVAMCTFMHFIEKCSA